MIQQSAVPFRDEPLILIVEDETSMREMMRRMFERENFQSMSVGEGLQVMDLVLAHDPALIVLDIQLPDISGFEVLRQIRNHPFSQRIPVIVVTAAADRAADVVHGLELDASDYMLKPFSVAELVARVMNKLRAHQFEKALFRRNQQLEQLIQLGTALNQLSALDALPKRIGTTLVAQFTPCLVEILLNDADDSDSDGNRAILRFRHELKMPDDNAVLLENSLHRLAFNYPADSILIYDTERTLTGLPDGASVQIFGGQGRSGMATAIVNQDTVVGMIVVGSVKPCAFNEDDLQVVRLLAEQVALAIQNTRYANHLESMITRRTEQLQVTQAKLGEAEKMAALGSLAAGVAHEINNPLQPIMTNLELTLEDLDVGNPVERELLENAMSEVERIQRSVRALLDYTRPSQGKRLPVALNEVLNAIMVLVGKKLEQANIRIRINGNKTPLHVTADKDELHQVILNLVLNARDAMPRGGDLVITLTEEEDDDGLYAVLTVQDNGTGIPADILPRIFDPFFTTKGTGSGLGLATSHRIIYDHDGTLTAESEVGVYTRFTLRLPLVLK